MIEIKGLVKDYPKVRAVNGVEFNVEGNGVFALLGLNGAGKTTLINMLATLTPPTSGTASVCGYDLMRDKEKIREIINISPQETAVMKRLTVKENLVTLATLYGASDPDSKAETLMREFNLTEKKDEYAKNLSGGQQRRLSIALALVNDPKILFLDEPTLGLDVKARRSLWTEVERLKKDRVIILTTHYLEEVESLADRAAIISRGEIKAIGTVSELISAAGADTLENAFLTLSEEEE